MENHDKATKSIVKAMTSNQKATKRDEIAMENNEVMRQTKKKQGKAKEK